MHHSDPQESAIVDAWLITFVAFDMLHAACKATDGGWLVWHRPDAEPEHLRTDAEALSFITELQRTAHATGATEQRHIHTRPANHLNSHADNRPWAGRRTA